MTLPDTAVYDLSADLVAASLDVEADRVGTLSVDSVSGSSKLKLGTLAKLDADTVSGGVKLELASTDELLKIDVDTVSGNAELTLTGERNYTVEFESLSGKLFGDAESGTPDERMPFEIEFDSVSGDLSVKKK